MASEKQVAKMAEYLSENIPATIRKHGESPDSVRAYRAIQKMPKTDWKHIAEALASAMLEAAEKILKDS